MYRYGTACAIALITSAAVAATAHVTAIDAAVDFASLQGKRLIVTDCVFYKAELDGVWCSLQTPRGPAGYLDVEANSMDRDLLRFMLNNCAGYEPRNECRTNVEATIGRTSDGRALLKDVIYAPQQDAE